MKRICFVLALVLLMVPPIFGATLHGNIYDVNLNKVNNVIVVIDTVPQQQYLAKDGTYSFEVAKGDYTLAAKNGNLSTADKVKITQDGKFVFDLFLFSSFAEEDEILKDIGNLAVAEEKKGFARYPLWTWLLAIGLILVLIGRAVLIKKKFDRLNGSQEIEVTMTKESKKEESKEESKKEVVDASKGVESVEIGDKPKIVGETLGDDNFEEEDEEPDYLNNTLEIIKKNEGRITQKKLRKKLMHLSEGKVSLILTELEHKGQIEKVKKGRGNVILLK